ncbi:MAG TPA: choice-of-anchor tandem repeat GloVer-containing protein [Opitutaceae bacterium]|nr:choice-of-anchor tandem repeat GloVer-containing protein [Opitutaceae bacterium]
MTTKFSLLCACIFAAASAHATPQVAAPTFSPGAGSYSSAQLVTISTTTSGATIRYTTDGSTPTETNGTVYSSSVSISSSTMLKAIAYESGFTDSQTSRAIYNITSSPAVVLNVLYDFTSSNGGGTNPNGLIQASDGNFYGTASFSGSGGYGTVFKMAPDGTLTTLVAFNSTNGGEPAAALVQGADGNFYGTTQTGGSASDGTVFKMTPAGTLTTLVSFNGTNGSDPYAALLQGSDGNFYGTTRGGGSASDGTVFQVTPAGVLTTLISFNGSNGANGLAGLVQDSSNKFYGTTEIGGSSNEGTLFQLTLSGNLTTLVTFNGSNGAIPEARLVLGSDGNFYGTTYGTSGDNGTIFRLTPAGVMTTLVSFGGTNGARPTASLLQGRDGNFYGTTLAGGSNNNGTLFTMTPAGAITTLLSFDSANGADPYATLIQGSDGYIYGTTTFGGGSNNGVIFQLILPSAATPTFSPSAGGYTGVQSVTISSATAGASIAYTTDGTTPTESGGTVTHGSLYSGPVTVGAGSTTLSAIAFESGYADSAVATAAYTISLPQAATPTISPAGGGYTSVQSVTISTSTSGASIAYTTDGTTPTESGGTVTHGFLYSGPVTVGAGNHTIIDAIAFKTGYSDSAPAGAGYSINLSPAFSIVAGTYASAQSVSITPAGAVTIRYTTDGSTPTETNGTIYYGPLNITQSTIVKAFSYGTGFIDSPVTSVIYTITSSPAAIVNVIHDFDPANSGGIEPFAGLTLGTDGNFYGTTYYGGSTYVSSSNLGLGTVFKLTPAGAFTTLVSFTGSNGEYPFAGVTQGSDGNFYGTTNPSVFDPASSNFGIIFKMTPGGALTTLTSFNIFAGEYPFAGLIQGKDGSFYGATSVGGNGVYGTLFKITPSGTSGSVMSGLVSFSGANGAFPAANLVQGSDGNFYGTTYYGGSTFVSANNPGDGTVFKVTPAGTLTTLVSFTGSNGEFPAAPLVQGSDGNFYSTTTEDNGADAGTVFKMTPAGALTTLAFFNVANGATPNGLMQGSDGNFYGTANAGGDSNNVNDGDGVIFRVTPAGNLTALVLFDGANGSGSLASLVQGSDGNYYGTTTAGGKSGYGVVFQLIVPPLTNAPVFSPAAGTYTSTQTVTITSATSGASIRYTTDGSTPTETHGTLYSGAISISATTTLSAIAYKSGSFDSPVTSGTYTISPTGTPAPAPSSGGGGGGGGGAPSEWFLGTLALLAALRWKLGPKARRENG